MLEVNAPFRATYRMHHRLLRPLGTSEFQISSEYYKRVLRLLFYISTRTRIVYTGMANRWKQRKTWYHSVIKLQLNYTLII